MAGFGVFFSVITSIIFWSIVLATFVRICQHAGLRVPLITDSVFFEKITLAYSRFISLVVRDGFKVILFGAAMRLFMIIAGFFILLHEHGRSPYIVDLFNAFTRGDSHHYITLAEIGYDLGLDGVNTLLVFFPLYPYLIRALNIFINNFQASAFIVSFVSYCVGLYYLFCLVRLDFDRKVAWWAVILISTAPPAFFFGTPMTESLMLLTSAMALYYIRTHRWALAGIVGALCVFTRMVGVVLIAVAAVEFIMHYKILALLQSSEWKKVFSLIAKKGMWILLMLAGGAAYLFINWQVSGDPFQFMYYQRTHWSNVPQYFGQTIISQFHLISFSDAGMIFYIFLPNVLAFSFAIFLLAYACIKRLPAIYIVYALGYTYISFSPSWLLSGARYMVACVPLFIFLAHAVHEKPTYKIPVLLVFIVGLFWMTRMFLLRAPIF